MGHRPQSLVDPENAGPPLQLERSDNEEAYREATYPQRKLDLLEFNSFDVLRKIIA